MELSKLKVSIKTTFKKEDLLEDVVVALCNYFNVEVEMLESEIRFTEKDGCPIRYFNVGKYLDVKIGNVKAE